MTLAAAIVGESFFVVLVLYVELQVLGGTRSFSPPPVHS